MLKEILITRGLSDRECEIAELVARGLPNKVVGAQVFICEKTVKYHLTNIYKKLHCDLNTQFYQKRHALAKWASQFIEEN